MTRDHEMTTGRSAQETAGAGARRCPPWSRSGRPARAVRGVVVTAAVPAAGGLRRRQQRRVAGERRTRGPVSVTGKASVPKNGPPLADTGS
ncbi:hypothetical protein [Streptomyces smyrnaeus]|uniref:hypothetical protein n=1 Tax=Streptomyces smyrnaeus TaxID=1387713 RepID=UPI0036BCE4EB